VRGQTALKRWVLLSGRFIQASWKTFYILISGVLCGSEVVVASLNRTGSCDSERPFLS
jgi:hypothetical protein